MAPGGHRRSKGHSGPLETEALASNRFGKVEDISLKRHIGKHQVDTCGMRKRKTRENIENVSALCGAESKH